MKIGGMTPCWNEEATIVFCVASLLPYVDHYVVVDSGSTDLTLPLLREFFFEEIKSGKLVIIEYGALADFDISKPKNAAIAKLREFGCEYFIRLDADDVFYKEGAKKACDIARSLDKSVTMFCINHWELYQYEAHTTQDWLNNIGMNLYGDLSDYPPTISFYCLRIPPGADPRPHMYPKRFEGSYGHARIYRTADAVSLGKWTDEAWGRGPGEDIGHPGVKRNCIGNTEEWIVHYGWARPMEKKLSKMKVWEGEGKERQDPRVDTIHKLWKNVPDINLDKINYGNKYWPHSVVFPFNDHPEVFYNLLSKIKDYVDEANRSRSSL
jgi:glycosyltransferase involved in cell wall biosynthesis